MTIEANIEDPGYYINTLNDSYPASGDTLTEGDNHIRGIKNLVKNTFPNVTGEVTPTHTELNLLDGLTAGTVTASKPVLVDSNKDISSFRNVGITGNITGFGGYVTDTNGNELLKFGTTASAVNEITVTNAATGNDASISASGEAGRGIILKSSDNDEILELATDGSSAVNGLKIVAKNTGTAVYILPGTGADADSGMRLRGSNNVNILALDTVASAAEYINVTAATAGGRPSLTSSSTAGLTVEGVIIDDGAINFGNTDLNYYREGTWTPTLLDDTLSASEGQTYNTQGGNYTRIGNTVFITGTLWVNSVGTLTGAQQARIGGLPFTSLLSATNAIGGISCQFGNSLNITAGVTVSGQVNSNAQYISLYLWDASTGSSSMTVNNVSAGGLINFFGQYFV